MRLSTPHTHTHTHIHCIHTTICCLSLCLSKQSVSMHNVDNAGVGLPMLFQTTNSSRLLILGGKVFSIYSTVFL